MTRRPSFVVAGLAIVAFMLIVSVWAWFRLPAGAQVPIHFNASGAANHYANKTVGLFILPLVAAVVLALRVFGPLVEPRRGHLERSRTAYSGVILAALALLAVVHVATVARDLGSSVDIVRVVMIGTGVMLAVMGNYLGKVRSNFQFGIRTPWTLSSERAWTRTHRLGGRLFALFGAALVVVALIAPVAWLTAIVVGGAAALAAILTVYSYLAWRADPARQPQH